MPLTLNPSQAVSTRNPQPRGVLGKGLDVLNQLLRPQSALFAAGTELLEGGNPLTAISEGFEELIEFDRQLSFQDVLDAGGAPEFQGRGAIEFAGDLLLDPLFLLPAGVFGKTIRTGALAGKPGAIGLAGIGSSYGIKALERSGIPGIQDLGVALPEVRKGLQKFFKGYSTETGKSIVKKQNALVRELQSAAETIQKDRHARDSYLRELARHEAKSRGISVEDALSEVKSALNAISESKFKGGPLVTIEDFIRADNAINPEIAGQIDVPQIMQMTRGSNFVPARAVKDLTPRTFRALKRFSYDRAKQNKVLLETDSHYRSLIKSGKEAEAQTFKSERINYVLHLIHPDAKKHLINNTNLGGTASGNVWNWKHASALERGPLKNISILEANDLALNGKIPFLPPGTPLFIDDPNLLDAVRTYRTIREGATIKFLQESAEKFGWEEVQKTSTILGTPKSRLVSGATQSKEAQFVQDILPEEKLVSPTKFVQKGDELVPLDDAFRKTHTRLEIDGFKDTWMPNDAADILNKHWEVMTNPTEMSKLANWFESSQSVWKLWTLAPFPAYHTRNVVGNLYNMYLAGMTNPTQTAKFMGMAARLQKMGGNLRIGSEEIDSLLIKGQTGRTASFIGGGNAEARQAQLGWQAASKESLRIGDVTQTNREWVQELIDSGAISGGVFAGEIPRADKGLGITGGVARKGGRVREEASRQFFGREGSVVGKMAEGGRLIESNARSSLYLWGRSQGMSVSDATDFMNKHLFDYANPDRLTDVTRRFAFPFFTWTRFNIPLQLEYLVNDPAKQALISKVRNSFENNYSTNQQMDHRYVAEWIRQGMNLRTRRNGGDGYDVFILNNWVPIADLAEVGGTALTEGVDEFAKQAGTWALQSLSPLIKVPIETATNYSFFYKREFLPEDRKFLAANMPEPLINILRSVRLLSVLDRFITSPREKDMSAEIIRLITGVNLQKVDLKTGSEFAFKEFKAKVKELEQAKARALRKGNDAAAEDMQKDIDSLKLRFGELSNRLDRN
jgi:hypothetical protein